MSSNTKKQFTSEKLSPLASAIAFALTVPVAPVVLAGAEDVCDFSGNDGVCRIVVDSTISGYAEGATSLRDAFYQITLESEGNAEITFDSSLNEPVYLSGESLYLLNREVDINGANNVTIHLEQDGVDSAALQITGNYSSTTFRNLDLVIDGTDGEGSGISVRDRDTQLKLENVDITIAGGNHPLWPATAIAFESYQSYSYPERGLLLDNVTITNAESEGASFTSAVQASVATGAIVSINNTTVTGMYNALVKYEEPQSFSAVNINMGQYAGDVTIANSAFESNLMFKYEGAIVTRPEAPVILLSGYTAPAAAVTIIKEEGGYESSDIEILNSTFNQNIGGPAGFAGSGVAILDAEGGGGLEIYISNSTFTEGEGAAIGVSLNENYGWLEISDVAISNHVGVLGSGININTKYDDNEWNNASWITMSNVSITDGESALSGALTLNQHHGGYLVAAIDGLTVQDNQSKYGAVNFRTAGGNFADGYLNLSITNSVISGNSAYEESEGFIGSALTIATEGEGSGWSYTQALISNSSISDNEGESSAVSLLTYGYGSNEAYQTTVFDTVTLSGNTNFRYEDDFGNIWSGGAVTVHSLRDNYNWGGTEAIFMNSTIVGNEAEGGSAVLATALGGEGELIFVNSTIARNTSNSEVSESLPAVSVLGDQFLGVYNSIVADNERSYYDFDTESQVTITSDFGKYEGADVFAEFSIFSADSETADIEEGEGTGNIIGDPKLGAFKKHNGADTKTVCLKSGSPAIDSASGELVIGFSEDLNDFVEESEGASFFDIYGSDLLSDQSGTYRLADDGPDMGALEYIESCEDKEEEEEPPKKKKKDSDGLFGSLGSSLLALGALLAFRRRR